MVRAEGDYFHLVAAQSSDVFVGQREAVFERRQRGRSCKILARALPTWFDAKKNATHVAIYAPDGSATFLELERNDEARAAMHPYEVAIVQESDKPTSLGLFEDARNARGQLRIGRGLAEEDSHRRAGTRLRTGRGNAPVLRTGAGGTQSPPRLACDMEPSPFPLDETPATDPDLECYATPPWLPEKGRAGVYRLPRPPKRALRSSGRGPVRGPGGLQGADIGIVEGSPPSNFGIPPAPSGDPLRTYPAV